MEQTVSSVACVRMEPPVTRPTENVHAPVDGWARPVNWVRPRVLLQKHFQMDRFRSVLTCYNLDLILAVLYKNILRSGNADVTTATADGARNRR